MNHRAHHRFADIVGKDPHSPYEYEGWRGYKGLVWAQGVWSASAEPAPRQSLPAAGGGEPGPAVRLGGQVGCRDGLTGPRAVQAPALIVLQLEQLQRPCRLAGGSHHPQLTERISKQQPGDRNVQKLLAAVSWHVQEVDHVEPGDHGVGQLDERRVQQLSVPPRSPLTKFSRQRVPPGESLTPHHRRAAAVRQTPSADDDVTGNVSQPQVMAEA
jgi:hypothetical protein